MSERYTVQYSKHDKDDPLFATDRLRLCPHCNPANGPIHDLCMFATNPQGEISTVCKKCLQRIRKEESEGNESEAVVNVMSTALTRAAEEGRASGHGFGDFFGALCEAAGGRQNLAQMNGRLVRRVLRTSLSKRALPRDIDRAVKICEQMIKAAAIEQKTGQPINWRDISEERQRDLLMEPAKLLLLGDRRFREELLSDPEVRKTLLSEVGVELLEARVDAEGDDET